MALNLKEDNIGVVIFGNNVNILEGDAVQRTSAIVNVLDGNELLGCVVDGICQPIDGGAGLDACQRSRAEVKAPGIILPAATTSSLPAASNHGLVRWLHGPQDQGDGQEDHGQGA